MELVSLPSLHPLQSGFALPAALAFRRGFRDAWRPSPKYEQPETRRGLQNAGVPVRPCEAGGSRQASLCQLQQRASRPASRERVRCSLPPVPLTGHGLLQLKWVVRVPGAQLYSPKKPTSSPGLGRDRCPCQKWVDGCVRMLHSGGGRDTGRLQRRGQIQPRAPWVPVRRATRQVW